MESFILYCDESAKKGKYFSNFYGGALIKARDREEINNMLINKCECLNFFSELKWTKVTENYLEKYIEFIDLYFNLISASKIKIRIMFTQNVHKASNLNDYHEENRYFLLYYQFIKHAFGLQYIEPKEKYGFHLSALLDELPEKDDRCKEFKEYLNSLEKYPPFRRRGWQISENDVADVNSKNHIILQGLDIILGGMQFRLNDKHKEKIPGTSNRGKRTIAKEKLYKYINKRIRSIYPNFNIGISTGRPNGHTDRWHHPYRHWLFIPSEREYVIGHAKNT